MKTEQLLGALIPIAFLSMWWLESRVRARAYQQERKWPLKGLSFLVLTLLIGGLFPLVMQLEKWRPSTWPGLAEYNLLGISLGLVITTLLSYWLHRAQHRWSWLWQLTHELHHRPKRVDMLGAFYAHPLEILLKVCNDPAKPAQLMPLKRMLERVFSFPAPDAGVCSCKS